MKIHFHAHKSPLRHESFFFMVVSDFTSIISCTLAIPIRKMLIEIYDSEREKVSKKGC